MWLHLHSYAVFKNVIVFSCNVYLYTFVKPFELPMLNVLYKSTCLAVFKDINLLNHSHMSAQVLSQRTLHRI